MIELYFCFFLLIFVFNYFHILCIARSGPAGLQHVDKYIHIHFYFLSTSRFCACIVEKTDLK